MTTSTIRAAAAAAAVQPVDILAGLGSADRALLAASLAMFEETTLQHRVRELAAKGTQKVEEWRRSRAGQEAVDEAAASVRSRMRDWQESEFGDDALRLVLWMYLREAFQVPPHLCVSMRSATTACDDLSAAALHFVGPSMMQRWMDKTGIKAAEAQPDCLDELVRPVLDELLKSVLKNVGTMDPAARERLVTETRARLEAITEADREQLLRAINADELNDAAIIKILVTAGGLTAFSSAVGLAGFSAYILAAQASAFIPLLSGPAVVSVVAVLSNPITVIGATLGAGWWATRSVNERVRAEVGIRVLSLLALQGLNAGREGVRHMLDLFSGVMKLTSCGDLDAKVLTRYQVAWRALESAVGERAALDRRVSVRMNSPADGGLSATGGLGRLLGADREELENAKILAGLTLGDILYSAASIDPTVMQAADFARIDDFSDPLAFAGFARKIMDMDGAAHLGAISNVKGYVAERVVAAQLSAHGHQVEFPATSNQEGWDISVDGVHFQIKDVADLGHLSTHFDHFDFPVIANAEVAQMLGEKSADALPDWAHQVYFVEGYNDELIVHITGHSIDAGDGMFHPHVPLFALGISAYRNVSSMRRGEVTGAQAVQQVAVDGTTRAGLAAVGGFAGNAIGFLVFGPAGALVLGGTLPILAQMQSGRAQGYMDRHLTSDVYRNWTVKAKEALAALATVLKRAIAQKLNLLRQRVNAVPVGPMGDYVRFRMDDDMRFLREARFRLEHLLADTSGVEHIVTRLYQWLPTSTIHPQRYQAELRHLTEVFQQRPTAPERLRDRIDDFIDAGKRFFGEAKAAYDQYRRGQKMD